MTDTVSQLLRHASCRDYRPDPVPDAEIMTLVRAAQQCATDATGQMYSLVRIQDPDLRATFTDLVGDQGFVAKAPVLFVVCLDTRRLALLLEHRGETLGMRPLVALLFGITDASLFAQSLVVAAESKGLGICYLGSVQNNACQVAALLRLPEGVVPLYGLTLGWPASTSAPKPRLPTSLVLHVDTYRDPSPAELDEAYDVMSQATRSGDWLNPIRKYFAETGIMAQREPEFWRLLSNQGMRPEPM